MKKVLSNISLLSLSNLITRFGTFLLVPLLTSVLSPGEFGKLIAAISLASLAGLFALNGQNSAIFRRKTLWDREWDFHIYEKAAVSICYIAFAFVLVLLMLLSVFLDFEKLFGLPFNLFEFCFFAVGIYIALDVVMINWIVDNQHRKIISLSVARAVSVLLLTYVFLETGLSTFARPAAESILGVVSVMAIGYIYFIRYPSFRLAPVLELRQELKDSFVYGWAMQISQISILVLSTFDRLMLNRISGSETAGVYAIVMLGLFPMFVVANANNIISVNYNRMYADSTDSNLIDSMLAKFVLLASCLTFLLKILLVFIGPFLVRLVAGNDYIEAAGYLYWVPDILLLYFIYLMITRYFHARSIVRVIIVTTAIAALINILLNSIFIPSHGIAGALGASIASYVAISLISAIMLAIYGAFHQYRRLLLVSLAAVISCGLLDVIILEFFM